MKQKIIFKQTLSNYNRKYRNYKEYLLKFTKKEVEDFDKKNKTTNKALLRNRKWWFINNTYYEVPRAIRWTWFRNLNAATQAGICLLGAGVIASAVVTPIVIMNNNKGSIKKEEKEVVIEPTGTGSELVKTVTLSKDTEGNYVGKIELKEEVKPEMIESIQVTVDEKILTREKEYTLNTSNGDLKIFKEAIKTENPKIKIEVKKSEEEKSISIDPTSITLSSVKASARIIATLSGGLKGNIVFESKNPKLVRVKQDSEDQTMCDVYIVKGLTISEPTNTTVTATCGSYVGVCNVTILPITPPVKLLSLTTSYTGNGSVSPSGTTRYSSGMSVTAKATPDSGWSFKEWKDLDLGTVVSTTASYTFTITKNTNLQAVFIEDVQKVTITASPNDATMGSVTGGGDYEIGEECILTATAKSGYRFVKWTENSQDIGTANPITFEVEKERSLIAVFEEDKPGKISITVTVEPEGAGLATGGGEFDEGDSVTLAAAPAKGYHFLFWANPDTQRYISSSNPYNFSASSNLNVAAMFEKDIHKIDWKTNTIGETGKVLRELATDCKTVVFSEAEKSGRINDDYEVYGCEENDTGHKDGIKAYYKAPTSESSHDGELYVESDGIIYFEDNDTPSGPYEGIFSNLDYVTTFKLNNIDTRYVSRMRYMFSGLAGSANQPLELLDLTCFDTSRVVTMEGMFSALNVKTIDLTSFDTTYLQDVGDMFNNSELLETIYVGNNFVINSTALTSVSSADMFKDCNSLRGGAGSNISSIIRNFGDEGATGPKYARIDRGREYADKAGYFTYKDSKETTTTKDKFLAEYSSISDKFQKLEFYCEGKDVFYTLDDDEVSEGYFSRIEYIPDDVLTVYGITNDSEQLGLGGGNYTYLDNENKGIQKILNDYESSGKVEYFVTGDGLGFKAYDSDGVLLESITFNSNGYITNNYVKDVKGVTEYKVVYSGDRYGEIDKSKFVELLDKYVDNYKASTTEYALSQVSMTSKNIENLVIGISYDENRVCTLTHQSKKAYVVDANSHLTEIKSLIKDNSHYSITPDGEIIVYDYDGNFGFRINKYGYITYYYNGVSYGFSYDGDPGHVIELDDKYTIKNQDLIEGETYIIKMKKTAETSPIKYLSIYENDDIRTQVSSVLAVDADSLMVNGQYTKGYGVIHASSPYMIELSDGDLTTPFYLDTEITVKFKMTKSLSKCTLYASDR